MVQVKGVITCNIKNLKTVCLSHSMSQLNENERTAIGKYAHKYLEAIKDKSENTNIEAHKEHERLFKSVLSKDRIDEMTEEDFKNLIKNLWAAEIWENKDWYVENKLLRPNSFENIKLALKELLYSNETLSKRIDTFRRKIQGFGISSISEILNFVFPDQYCLWNAKPKTVLPILGITGLPDRFLKYNIQSGDDYEKCIDVLSSIRDELGKQGFESPNFIDLDCFFWYIFETTDIKVEKTKLDVESKSRTKKMDLEIPKTHEEVEYFLIQLGNMLGYSTYTADPSKIAKGKMLSEFAPLRDIPEFTGQRDRNSAKEIDVIWFDNDENPKLCMEVENTTNVTSGLNRLYQLKQFDINFVIVAPEEKRPKFVIEIDKAPYRSIRERYKFMSYEELIRLYNSAKDFVEKKQQFLGDKV